MAGLECANAEQDAHACRQAREHQTALLGWGIICKNPNHAASLYFGGTVVSQLIFSVLFLGGFPWPTWHTVIPELYNILCTIATTVCMYLFGPVFAKSRVSRISSEVRGVSISFMCVSSFVGPLHYVPFGKPVLSTLLMSGAYFALFTAAECGGVATNHPEEPHSTIAAPLIRATTLTIRGLNTVTDLRVARVMFIQVCCSAPDPCHRPGKRHGQTMLGSAP